MLQYKQHWCKNFIAYCSVRVITIWEQVCLVLSMHFSALWMFYLSVLNHLTLPNVLVYLYAPIVLLESIDMILVHYGGIICPPIMLKIMLAYIWWWPTFKFKLNQDEFLCKLNYWLHEMCSINYKNLFKYHIYYYGIIVIMIVELLSWHWITIILLPRPTY